MAIFGLGYLGLFEHKVLKLLREIRKNMATQADIDALVAQSQAQTAEIQGLKTKLTTIGTEVSALVAANQGAGNPLDLTALQAAVAAEGAAITDADTAADAVQAEFPPTAPTV